MLVQKLLFYACETTLYQAFFVDLTKEMGELWQAASNRLSKDIIIKKKVICQVVFKRRHKIKMSLLFEWSLLSVLTKNMW